MNIYSVTKMKTYPETKYFTSKRKCMNYLEKAMGHAPAAADVRTDKITERRCLYGEELQNALKGNWEFSEICFYERTASRGLYLNPYEIIELVIDDENDI